MATHARAPDMVARTRVWMSGVGEKIRFLREGLFAKYVISLVGLVVFVLAVNGAMETWISYRATRTTLTDGMSEKAEATARRIEQSAAELERQISWVTRASATKQYERDTMEQRRNDYAQLLNQVPAVNQLSFLNGSGREQLRLSRLTIAVNSNTDFSRDLRFTETVARGVTFAPAYFRGSQPYMSIAVSHSGFNAGVTIAEIDLRLLSDFLGDAQVGKSTLAYVVDSQGVVLASSAKGPEIGKDVLKLPQPDNSLALTNAVWHSARGIAFANLGRTSEAEQEQKTFHEVVAKIPSDQMYDMLNNRGAVFKIHENVLAGAIAHSRHDDNVAIDFSRFLPVSGSRDGRPQGLQQQRERCPRR